MSVFDDGGFDDPPCAVAAPAASKGCDSGEPEPASVSLEAMREEMEREFAAKLKAVEAQHVMELQAAQRLQSAPRADDYDAKSVPP